MKRYLISFIILWAFQNNILFASHLMGGEITWTCLSNGTYVFHMKLYRDCNGTTGPTSAIIYTNAPGFPNGINLDTISVTDISPVCNPAGPAITCAGATGTTAGSVQEFVYQSQPVTLNGIPSSTGWTFWYTNCCRNASIINLSIPQASFTLHSTMYSYNGQNTNPCFESSPLFAASPELVKCNGYPFNLNASALDPDNDSLSYQFDSLRNANTGTIVFNAPPIPYSAPYSVSDPFNGQTTLQNGGFITTAPTAIGSYAYAVKVSAYRCGLLVAEVFREALVQLTTCREIMSGIPNNPPAIIAPFIDPSSGLQTSYVDTVHAGDTVSFTIQAQDFDTDSLFNFQYMHITASGAEFDSTDTIANGNCLHPPCATLTPQPLNYYAQLTATINFNWITTCDLLLNGPCSQPSALYVFNFIFKDDFCRIPGQSYQQVKIFVMGDSVPSILQSVDTLLSSLQAASYQWYLNGNAIGGGNLSYFIPTLDGSYQVETSHAGGCATISPPYYFSFLSTAPGAPVVSVDISPNPFNHWVHVHARKKTESITILLRDVLGKIISIQEYSSTDPVLDETYDLSGLTAGIYLMQFKTGSAQKTFKLVKYDE